MNKNFLKFVVTKLYLNLARSGKLRRFRSFRDIEGLIEESKIRRFWDSPPAPSVDESLRPLVTTLYDTVHVEDFNALKNGLQEFFPGLRFGSRVQSSKDPLNSLDEFEDISWHSIGRILNSTKYGSSIVRDTEYLCELPIGVDYVSLKLRRLSPSIAVLIYVIHFGDYSAFELRLAQMAEVEPPIYIKNLWPWRLHESIWVGNREVVVREKIKNWHEDVQRSIELKICQKIRKERQYRYSRSKVQLPAVRGFALISNSCKTIGENFISSRKWVESHFPYIESSYRDDHYAFVFDYQQNGDKPSAHSAIVMYSGLMPKLQDSKFANSLTSKAERWMEDNLDDLMPRLVHIEYLNMFAGLIYRLRRLSFLDINRQKRALRITKLADQVVRLCAVFDRTREELGKSNLIWDSEYSVFRKLKRQRFDTDRSKTMVEEIDEYIRYRTRELGKMLKSLNASVHGYLEVTNVRAQLLVQRFVIYLTVVGTIASLIQGFASFENALMFFKSLIK